MKTLFDSAGRVDFVCFDAGLNCLDGTLIFLMFQDTVHSFPADDRLSIAASLEDKTIEFTGTGVSSITQPSDTNQNFNLTFITHFIIQCKILT